MGALLSGAAQAAPVGNGLSAQAVEAARARPDQVAFRALYKEMVETDTRSPPEAAPCWPTRWRRICAPPMRWITRAGPMVAVLPGSSKT
jgi:hypothetical protein